MTKCFYLIPLLFNALLLAGCDGASQSTRYQLPHFVTQEGANLVVSQGDLRMTLMPDVAGRIGSFKYRQHELLRPPVDQRSLIDWGTVLWSSPQIEWNWPPIETLDSKPYHLSATSDSLVLTSDVDTKTGYQFSKIYALQGLDAISVTYRIYNFSNHKKHVGAIEVTRLPAAGDVFYPRGQGPSVSGIFYPIDLQEIGALSWYHYDMDEVRNDHHKAMQDGSEGWVAYANSGHILVKEFVDNLPGAIAEGEREIEIFAHIDHTFIEMKQQSAAVDLAPGDHLEWTVIWRAAALPEPLLDHPQPDVMANYARQLLGR